LLAGSQKSPVGQSVSSAHWLWHWPAEQTSLRHWLAAAQL
jgi:hypothetical protein